VARNSVTANKITQIQDATDYFLYRAGMSGPKLSLLPRCYSTKDEVMVAAALDWITKSPMYNEFTIGLLTGEDFVVAELEFDSWVDSEAPLVLWKPSSSGSARGRRMEKLGVVSIKP
jgi:hypothetical protein